MTNSDYLLKAAIKKVTEKLNEIVVEKIEEVELDDKEKAEFNHSIEAVKKLWEAASAIDPDLKR